MSDTTHLYENAPEDEPPGRVRLGRVLAVFAGCLIAVLVAGYLIAPKIAELFVERALAAHGFPEADLRVTKLGLTEIGIADVSLGGSTGVAARRVIVAYSPGRLASGSIDGITLEAPHLPMTLGPGGIQLEFLSSTPSSDEGGGIKIVGPVTVRDGELILNTPWGEVEASLDGRVLFTDGLGTTVEAKVDLRHPNARMKGRLNGVLDADGQMGFDVVIDDAASDARIAFSEMTGTLRIGGKLPDTLDGAGTLTVRDAAVDRRRIGNLDVSGTVTDTRAEVGLVLGGDGTGLSAQIALVADNVLDPDARVHISGDAATDGLKGPADLPGAIDMIGAVAFELSGRRGDFQAISAILDGREGEVSSGVQGWIEADHLSIDAPNTGVDATVNGRLDLSVDNAGWRASSPSLISVDGGFVAGGVRKHITADITTPPGQALVAGGLDRARAVVAAARIEGQYDDHLPLAGDLSGKVWLDEKQTFLIEEMTLAIDPKPLRVGGLEVAVEKAALMLSGTPGDLTVDTSFAAGINGTLGKGTEIVGGRVNAQSRVDVSDDAIRAYPPGCFDFNAVTIRHDGLTLRPQPFKLCPPADGGPMVTARLEDGGLKRIESVATLGSAEIVADGALPYPITGTLPRVDGNAAYDPARDTWWLRFETTGGTLRVEGPDLAVADVQTQGEIAGKGAHLVGIRIPKVAFKIVDHQRPQRIAPVAVAAKTDLSGREVKFEGTLSLPGSLQANVEARHRFDNKRGSAQFKIPGWTFAEDGRQPHAAFPILRGVVTGVSGSITAEGRADWTDSRESSSGRITLDNLSFATTSADIAGITGQVRFSDLITMRAEGQQIFTIAFVDAGVPLVNGEARLRFPGDLTMHLDSLTWPFAGGTIGASNIKIPLDELPSSLSVDMDGLDASSLVGLMDVPDLEARGTLTGRVPVIFKDGEPFIEQARIRSIGGGSIRYRAQGAAEALRQSGSSAEILADALANFQFTDINMTLDGPLNGEIKARAEIKGSNPDLYNGKRIELNVNLSGVLRDLLRSATVLNELPASIRDRVQGSAGNR